MTSKLRAAAVPSLSEDIAAPSRDSTPRVLVVDDRKENLFATQQMLERIGVTVDLAESGGQGLRLLLDNTYAVVLMDVQMPDMDGYETVELMQRHRRTRDVPVIFLTAIHTDTRYVTRGYAAGAVDYLTKPIIPEVLAGKVRVFVELALRDSQLRDSMDRLRKLEDHNKLILDYASEGILGVDRRRIVISANPAAERILACKPGTLTGRKLDTIVALEENDAMPEAQRQPPPLFRAIEKGFAHRGTDDALRSDDGRAVPVECAYAPFHAIAAEADAATELAEGGVLIFQDITERIETKKQLLRQAKEDPLTGLPNRAYLHDVLQRAIIRHERGGKSLAFMMVDLDRFKNINDIYGHEKGDEVLVALSKRLQDRLRGSDVVGRLGGDEFGVVLDEVSEPIHAARIANKLLACLGEGIETASLNVSVGMSMGIAFYPDHATTAQGLIKAADIAMYEAKKDRNNTYHFFTEEMQERVHSRSQFEQDMKAGLKDQFNCAYQPIFDAKTLQLTNIEALARWHHPRRGNIPPDQFIAVAEESGLIHPLGEHLMRTAFKQARQWLDAGILKEHQRIAVNISLRQLVRGKLDKIVTRILAEVGLPPENIQFEVTESTIMAEPDLVISLLEKLRDMGITIELDDFGTGYSSLSHLAKLPLNGLKIDRSFVDDLVTNTSNQAIVLATTKMAHAMRLAVTAEGVETLEQAEFLRAHGCDRLQGYYFAKPQPPHATAEIFKQPDLATPPAAESER